MDLAKGTINDAEAAANRVIDKVHIDVVPDAKVIEDHAAAHAQDLMSEVQASITKDMLAVTQKLDLWLAALGKYKIQINVEVVKK